MLYTCVCVCDWVRVRTITEHDCGFLAHNLEAWQISPFALPLKPLASKRTRKAEMRGLGDEMTLHRNKFSGILERHKQLRTTHSRAVHTQIAQWDGKALA